MAVATVPCKSYALEFKGDFSEAGWTSLAPVAGDGTVKVLQDLSASSPHRFYRVHILD